LNDSAKELARLKTAGVTAKDSPWLWLAESKMSLHLFNNHPENQKRLTAFVQGNPDDPASLLLSQGREIIPRLIPLLEDVSPTRSAFQVFWDETAIVRVRDLALAIIELKSGCSFCEQDAVSRRNIHTAVEAWWADAATVSYENGIRIGMKDAGYYGKVRMAGLLIRAFALQTLRHLVDEGNLYMAVHAGEVLEAHGDAYCRKAIMKRLKADSLKNATSFDPSADAIFFLAEHGGREEWSLVTQWAEAQLRSEEAGKAQSILQALMYTNRVATSKFAIPSLALALRAKQFEPKVGGGGEEQHRATVWKAVVNLQKLTGKSFGATEVVPDASEWQRVTAQVNEWWDRTGKRRYTFERIAEMERQR
jgi:hypothetical protein